MIKSNDSNQNSDSDQEVVDEKNDTCMIIDSPGDNHDSLFYQK